MLKTSKGVLTKKHILDSTRNAFNTKGINLTLDQIAKEVNINKGKITNHFSTKDNLFLAILADYEEQLRELFIKHHIQFQIESSDLQSSIFILSKVMDIQFEYRCSIIYLNMLSPGQNQLFEFMQENFKRNITVIKSRITKMVEKRLLNEMILENEHFNSFIFIYVTMLTQWVVFYEMYNKGKAFSSVKSFYLRTILLHSYSPYFTKKGIRSFDALDISSI